MKTKEKLFSVLMVLLSLSLFYSCNSVYKISNTQTTYEKTQKSSEDLTCSYILPVIKPTAKTQITQTKGGVTISVEIVPFTADLKVKRSREITFKDPNKPGYDIYEVSNTPVYEITPENIQFNIRIRNNEQVPLKLSEIGFALIIDGNQWSYPQGRIDEWNKRIILTGMESSYSIPDGPQLKGLYNSKVVYLFLNGVPTSYDSAGNVTKKSNFEWYFECKSEEVQKTEKQTYSYEPTLIETKRCDKCSGTGTDPQRYQCSYCKGNGSYVSTYDGKTYKCSKCNGSGVVYIKCDNCAGKGVLSFPKSVLPGIAERIYWNGWVVTVQSKPAGATIQLVSNTTGKYVEVCTTPCKVNWMCTSDQTCPIIISYSGSSVKVLPEKSDGNPSAKIVVDFTSGSPIVIKGEKVE